MYSIIVIYPESILVANTSRLECFLDSNCPRIFLGLGGLPRCRQRSIAVIAVGRVAVKVTGDEVGIFNTVVYLSLVWITPPPKTTHHPLDFVFLSEGRTVSGWIAANLVRRGNHRCVGDTNIVALRVIAVDTRVAAYGPWSLCGSGGCDRGCRWGGGWWGPWVVVLAVAYVTSVTRIDTGVE